MKPDQSRLTTLLTDTVILLCKSGLNFQTTLRIEGVLGITIDDSDVFIVHLNESVSGNADLPAISAANSASEGVTETNEDSYPAPEKRTLFSSRQRFRTSCRVAGNRHRATITSSKEESKSTVSTKDASVLADSAEPVNCSSSECSEKMDFCIKEENCDDDSNVRDIILAGTSGSGKFEKEMSLRWRKGKKQNSSALPSGNCNAPGEVFSTTEEIKTEAQGGDWNLDPLVLSNLPSSTDGETPPWIGYMWNGGLYGSEYMSVGADHVQSQSLVPSNHSFTKRRSLRDDLNTSMQRQFLHGDVAMLKPFACPVAGCHRRFFHRNNVYRHRKQKHGENVGELAFVSRRH